MFADVTVSGKNRRLKQAKEEAQAEIEQYRLQRDKEFKTKEAAVSTTLCFYAQYTINSGNRKLRGRGHTGEWTHVSADHQQEQQFCNMMNAKPIFRCLCSAFAFIF